MTGCCSAGLGRTLIEARAPYSTVGGRDVVKNEMFNQSVLL